MMYTLRLVLLTQTETDKPPRAISSGKFPKTSVIARGKTVSIPVLDT